MSINVVPYLFYLVGSLCFVVGTLIAMALVK